MTLYNNVRKIIVLLLVTMFVFPASIAMAKAGDSGCIIHNFSEGLAAMEKGGQWGYIDPNGKWIIEPQYSSVTDFHDGVALVEGSYLIDKEGKRVATWKGVYFAFSQLNEGLYPIRKDEKNSTTVHYGYADIYGKQVLPYQYKRSSRFSEGLALVELENEYAFIDKNGKTVILFDNKKCTLASDTRISSIETKQGFIDGYAVIGGTVYNEARTKQKGYAYIIVDKKGNFTFVLTGESDLTTKLLNCGNGIFMIWTFDRDNGKYYYVDAYGKKIIKEQFAYWPFEFISARYYKENSMFRDGIALVGIDKKGKVKPCYIDTEGNVLISGEWDDAFGFSEGMAAVHIDGKWGYINTDGDIVIDPQYDWVRPFSCGYAIVELGDDWYIIDKEGNVLY